MADETHGVGGLHFDKSKRGLPQEAGVFFALIAIVTFFELVGRLFLHSSFLFNTDPNSDAIFNIARLKIIILQVSIIGIIAIGVTQVIILGGIDLSSGSLVGATAMIVMSFAQTEFVNGNPNPKAYFGPWAMDLPIFIPIIVGLAVGALAGAINGSLIAFGRIPPFIATLSMFLAARGVAFSWSNGQPLSFPTEGFAKIGTGMLPAFWFLLIALVMHLALKYTVYGKHTYAIGSNEAAARMSGINVSRHKLLVYIIASMLASIAAIILSSKNLTAQTGMGEIYELYAIAMAVLGGVSLAGGRGSILGTILGALVFGVIQSGFIFLKIKSSYQLIAFGAIIALAVLFDQWRLNRTSPHR